jgi:hypothetical protein
MCIFNSFGCHVIIARLLLLLQILSLSDTPAGQYILFLTDTYLSRLVRIEFIQKESKMAPSRPQKILSVIALAALKPITRSIGAFIGSGLVYHF